MSKDNIDRIIELAFGELTPSEAEEMKDSLAADPGLLREMMDYQQLKDDLVALRAVPAHQLSTERLKDAILQQGLTHKPANTLSIFQWLWAPAAAACLVAAFMITKNAMRPDPKVMMGESASIVAPKPSFATPVVTHDFTATKQGSNPVKEQLDDQVTDIPEAIVLAPAPKVGHFRAAVSHKSFRSRGFLASKHVARQSPIFRDLPSGGMMSDTKLQATSVADSSPMELAPVVNTVAPQNSAGLGGPVARGMALKTQSMQAPVVVISAANDEQSGANVAREVENSDPIIIGG